MKPGEPPVSWPEWRIRREVQSATGHVAATVCLVGALCVTPLWESIALVVTGALGMALATVGRPPGLPTRAAMRRRDEAEGAPLR